MVVQHLHFSESPLFLALLRGGKCGHFRCEALSHVAAAVLSSPEGGSLRSEDIVIEIDDVDYLDINVKQLNVRVWAHDYPSRRGDKLTTLDATRKMMARAVCEQLPPNVTWYVWVLLAPTSYGSDTVDS